MPEVTPIHPNDPAWLQTLRQLLAPFGAEGGEGAHDCQCEKCAASEIPDQFAALRVPVGQWGAARAALDAAGWEPYGEDEDDKGWMWFDVWPPKGTQPSEVLA